MSKVPNGFEVIQLFEQFSPKHFAVEGDKIGLQIGTLNKPIHNVMIALDVLDEVIDEAINKKVDLIIAHHPPIFRPLKSIQTDTPAGKMIEKCIKNDLAIYAAHTNLDVAKGGVNDLLAEALGLENYQVLSPTIEHNEESLGLGRIGTLKDEMSLEEFAEYVKQCLGVEGVRVVGRLNERVKKVAVLGGDGNKYISQAKFKGADVFVTGDVYYHVAHDAMMMGLNIIDPGHHIEQIMKKGVTEVLTALFAEKKYNTTVFPSEGSTDAFTFI